MVLLCYPCHFENNCFRSFSRLLYSFSKLISGKCHVNHNGESSNSQDGPCHYSWLSFKSLLLIPLIGRSVGLCLVFMYRKSISCLSVISLILFLTNSDWLPRPLIHCKTHLESLQRISFCYFNFQCLCDKQKASYTN